MLFLACDMDVGLLKVIVFVKQLLNVVFIAIPIGLIVMLMVDLAKNVMAGKEDDQRKNIQIALKRVIYAVVIFFVPYVVNLAMKIVDETLEALDISAKYSSCYNITNEEVKLMAKTQCTDKGGTYDESTEVCETKNIQKETGEKIEDKTSGDYCRSTVVTRAFEQNGATKVCYYYNEEAQNSPSEDSPTRYYGWIEFLHDGTVHFNASDDMEQQDVTIEEMKKQQEDEDGTSKEWGDTYISASAIRTLIGKSCPKYFYIDVKNDNSVCVANSSGLSDSYCENKENTDGQDTFTIYPLEATCTP